MLNYKVKWTINMLHLLHFLVRFDIVAVIIHLFIWFFADINAVEIIRQHFTF